MFWYFDGVSKGILQCCTRTAIGYVFTGWQGGSDIDMFVWGHCNQRMRLHRKEFRSSHWPERTKLKCFPLLPRIPLPTVSTVERYGLGFTTVYLAESLNVGGGGKEEVQGFLKVVYPMIGLTYLPLNHFTSLPFEERQWHHFCLPFSHLLLIQNSSIMRPIPASRDYRGGLQTPTPWRLWSNNSKL